MRLRLLVEREKKEKVEWKAEDRSDLTWAFKVKPSLQRWRTNEQNIKAKSSLRMEKRGNFETVLCF